MTNQTDPQPTGRAMTMREIREALGHSITGPAPAADRPALRELVVEALYDARRPGLGGMTEAEAVAHMADAVLAAMRKTADRAAVLLEAADFVANHPGPIPYRPQLNEDGGFWWDTRDRDAVAAELRAVSSAGPAPATDRDTLLSDVERQFLTYALDLAADQMTSLGEEFGPDDEAAMERLRRMAGEAQQDPRCTRCTHPKGDHDGRADHREKHSPLVAGEPWCHACNAECDYTSDAQQDEPTESVLYEVVGDWGVDSADSAEGARAAVAKWLRAYPKCGAHAQQRVYREWPDGSEFYGPWTDLPDPPAAVARPGQHVTDEEARVVGYRSPLPGALSLYCTRHTDELGTGVIPLTSDDLPNGGLCVQCGADLLIPQPAAGGAPQLKEA